MPPKTDTMKEAKKKLKKARLEQIKKQLQKKEEEEGKLLTKPLSQGKERGKYVRETQNYEKVIKKISETGVKKDKIRDEDREFFSAVANDEIKDLD